MIRILIDTNVLVAAAYNRGSASQKVLQAVQEQKLKLIVSPAILKEYEQILPRAIRSEGSRDEIWEVIELARVVEPEQNPSVTEDRSDDKFLAAAVTAGADAIVTNDEHLLAVHPYNGIDILQPAAFWDSGRRIE